MIKFVHQHSDKIVAIYKDGKQLEGYTDEVVATFWKIANEYPDQWICWVEENQFNNINEKLFFEVFHHKLIMASCAVKTSFFSEDIGYIDQFPFAAVNRLVNYPTWLMSSDLGAINASVLLKFQNELKLFSDFDYLLNAIAKLGQQNGLYCYHSPQLAIKKNQNIRYKASEADLFSFTFQFYKKIRAVILFICCIRYKNKYPFKSFIFNSFKKNFFSTEINFSDITIESSRREADNSVDAIIPTIGRPKHLLNVLKDLKNQTLLPQKVIIVEQNPDAGSISDFTFITEDWPFEIQHIFTHQTGACNARNIALEKVTASWVFFCDDDIRFNRDVLNKAFISSVQLGVDGLNLNCKQKDEKSIYFKIKQWASFGSGTSFVHSKKLKSIRFDTAFEHGYGEDKDFGMQLRNQGVDIVFHPDIEIIHLKAPMGGFRTKMIKAWEKTEITPKPSPTVMRFIQKNYTLQQQRGYKIILWLKFYKSQKIKNPFVYKKIMQKRWEESKSWAAILQQNK